MTTFEFRWSGTRVPKEVLFPDGHIEYTQYMRDGLILFRSGVSAEYERIDPDYSAKFTVHENFEDKLDALNSYMSKQP